MKRLGIVLILVYLPLHANVTYRKAVPEDSYQISMLQSKYSNSDKTKLVVYPEQIQRNIILEKIQKKCLYVAYQEETDEVISFLECYIVPPNETDSILKDLLCLKIESPIDSKLYSFSAEDLIDFRKPIRTSENLNQNPYNPDFCLHLYLGSGYTSQKWRGRGINTKLLEHSTDSVMNPINKSLANIKSIAMLYGQISVNANSTILIRNFAKWIHKAFPHQFNEDILLQHLRSPLYKPEAAEDGITYIIKDKEHEGYGNMVLFTI